MIITNQLLPKCLWGKIVLHCFTLPSRNHYCCRWSYPILSGCCCMISTLFFWYDRVYDFPTLVCRFDVFIGYHELISFSFLCCIFKIYILISPVENSLQVDHSGCLCVKTLSLSIFMFTLSLSALEPDFYTFITVLLIQMQRTFLNPLGASSVHTHAKSTTRIDVGDIQKDVCLKNRWNRWNRPHFQTTKQGTEECRWKEMCNKNLVYCTSFHRPWLFIIQKRNILDWQMCDMNTEFAKPGDSLISKFHQWVKNF